MSVSPGTRMLMSLCGVCDWEEARVAPSDSSHFTTAHFQFNPKKENKQHEKKRATAEQMGTNCTTLR